MFDFETVQQNECNISNYKLLMGSISQQLINDIIELRLISQPDYTLESVQDEQILLYVRTTHCKRLNTCWRRNVVLNLYIRFCF